MYITSKNCSTCKESKPATPEFFYRNKSKPDGLTYVCKTCNGARDAKRWRNNPKRREQNASYVANAREDRRKKASKHYYENRERHIENNRKWAEKNKAKVKRDRKAKYWRDPEKARAATIAWNRENPEKVLEHSRNKRARRRGAEGTHTAEDVAKQFELQGGRCYWCGEPVDAYHIDHRFPLSKGGSNGPENIVVSCPECNMAKKAATPLEFAGRMF